MAASKIKVKLLTSRVDGNDSWVPGDIVEVSADEARALIAGDYAEPVAETRAKKATKATKTTDADTR